MLKALAQQFKETGQTWSENPAHVTKIILDSLAFRYASVLRTIEKLINQKIAGVQIVGGGGRNDYLNRMTASACGLPVQAGLFEATVTGNILIQAIVAKRFSSLQQARQHVAENINLKNFTAQKLSNLTEAMQQYAKIEARYLS
jgi:rhamnulokinase